MAQHLVARGLRALGGKPALREEYETDNGNVILDVTGLDFADPESLERTIDMIPGVVECGIFALRRADVALVATARGVRTLQR
jgi:ribose 5-phosphate isomerase A